MLHEQFFDSDKDELVTTWNLFIMFEKSSWFINAQMHYTVIWINDLFSYFFPLQSSLESDVAEKQILFETILMFSTFSNLP